MTHEAELRIAMRRFPAGVAVVTVALDTQRVGLTVSAVTSLSLDPPLVSVAISRQAAMHELLAESQGFSLSLLSGDQVGLAQHFARGVPPIAMWEGIELHRSDGPPLLSGASAWLDCALVDEFSTGDHTLFVGGVTRTELGRSGGGALAYVEQEYVVA
jgi:flavin reductase (DIM6/NTAB) family NADH-FMN oxidoreductase RutF